MTLPFSRTACSLLGINSNKFQVLLRQSGEERAGKQGSNTLYKNRARFVTAQPIVLKFLECHQPTCIYYQIKFEGAPATRRDLRLHFQVSISIAGTVDVKRPRGRLVREVSSSNPGGNKFIILPLTLFFKYRIEQNKMKIDYNRIE